MTQREQHRAALLALPVAQWDAYLATHSDLPGPRANLELLAAVGDVADPAYLRACAASDDEYRAACGAAGLGRLAAEGDPAAPGELRRCASDESWRVREGVAMGLQRLGDAEPAALVRLVADWADGPPLVQRAAVAGVCEPRLLRAPATATAALDLLDRVTASLASLAADRRRAPDARTLRQGLGYCWSVAVAAAPAEGFPRLERWSREPDPDVRWVVRENLRKARLDRADPERTRRLRDALG